MMTTQSQREEVFSRVTRMIDACREFSLQLAEFGQWLVDEANRYDDLRASMGDVDDTGFDSTDWEAE